MACAAGRCAVASCAAGFANCDGVATNGCEVDTRGDIRNCGACGTVCAAGSAGTTAACASGTCALTCGAATGNCDGLASNGCEVDLNADARHCGACGRACSAGLTCVVGVCALAPPPPLNTPRYDHAAVTTAGGTVAVMGGYDTAVLSSLEVYTPSTNTWAPRQSMPGAIRSHAAVALPDGRVLVAGGVEFSTSYTRAALIYTPSTDTWEGTSPLLTGRSNPAMARGLDGRVYIFGGSTSAPAVTASVEMWDPTTGLWTARTPAPTARSSARAYTGADGRIWVMGGVSGTAAAPVYPLTIDVYTPATDSWTTASVAFPAARYGFGATVGTDGRFYVLGGYTPISGGLSASRTVTALDPRTGVFTSLALMPQSRSTPAAATLPDGRILAIGGNVTGFGSTNRVDVYNPITNAWR
jgi:N-acetylneuraminic acid mutarotase